MANFEEKILAYLDGSLSEADRKDVLAGISGEHASERALFDAHLRLHDLYSVVRKPVSAPLSVQRELAAQIPVLAIKLPYLAAPDRRRNRVAAGWFSAMPSSWVNVFLLLAAVLLAGGVWYAVTTHSHHAASSVTNIAAGEPHTGGSPDAASGNASTNMASSIAPSSNITPSNPGITNATKAHVSSYPINAPYLAKDNNSSLPTHSNISHSAALHDNRSGVNSSTKISSMRTSNARNVSAHGGSSRLAHLKGTSTTEGTLGNSSESTHINKVHSDVNSEPSAHTLVNENPAKPAEANPPDLPQLTLHPVDVAKQPINFHARRDILIGYPTEDNTSSFVPLHVYASEGSRFIVPMPISKLSSFVTETNRGITGNTIVPSTEFGAEYEITPWTSAGVRMGYTSFAQYQSFTHPGSYSLLNEQYSDVTIQAVPAFWTALAITQTFNPQDRAQFSLSLAGGPAFTAPVAWLGMIEPSVTYDLSPTFLLRGGVSYDIIQVKQSTQNVNTSTNATSGIIIASTGGTLRSNAFGLNLGISFHP